MKKSKTILDAIQARQNSYKGKPIMYLDTLISYGKYKDYRIDYILLNDTGYVRWMTSTYKGFISDEVALKLKQ